MYRCAKFCVFVAIVVLSTVGIISCDLMGDDDSGGSGGGGISNPYLGQSFTLPSGTIVDWGDDFDGSADIYVFLDDSPSTEFGPVTVGSDGRFPGMQITAPQGELDLLKDFADEYMLNIDNNDARWVDLWELEVWQGGSWVGDVYRESSDGRIEVEWWYVDRDVRVWGEGAFEDEDYSVGLDVDLELRSGWNQVILRYDSSFSTVTFRVGSEPSGVRWEYW